MYAQSHAVHWSKNTIKKKDYTKINPCTRNRNLNLKISKALLKS